MWEFLMHKSLSFFFRIPSLFTDMWSPPLIFYFIRRICNFLGWFLLSAFFLVLSGAFLFSPDEFYSPRRICSPWITFVLPGFIWWSPDEVEFCSPGMSFIVTGWILFSPDEFCSHRMSLVFLPDEFCSLWMRFALLG